MCTDGGQCASPQSVICLGEFIGSSEYFHVPSFAALTPRVPCGRGRIAGRYRFARHSRLRFCRRRARQRTSHRLSRSGQSAGVAEAARYARKAACPWALASHGPSFRPGRQLLEGLNVGAIDFGYVGEVPPVFAQAAGANFVYTAYEIPTPHSEGILVLRVHRSRHWPM